MIVEVDQFVKNGRLPDQFLWHSFLLTSPRNVHLFVPLGRIRECSPVGKLRFSIGTGSFTLFGIRRDSVQFQGPPSNDERYFETGHFASARSTYTQLPPSIPCRIVSHIPPLTHRSPLLN